MLLILSSRAERWDVGILCHAKSSLLRIPLYLAALAVVRECPACLFTATTSASHVALTSMIAVRAKSARPEVATAKPSTDSGRVRTWLFGRVIVVVSTSSLLA